MPGDYARYLLSNWTREYPYFWPPGKCLPRPYTWMRARVLHALYPADLTLCQKMSSPIYIGILLLKFSSYYAVPVFAFTFFLIDKRDEYQIVMFILAFKQYQFLTGVYYACSLATTFFFCLEKTDYILGVPRACDADTGIVDHDNIFAIAMEVPRLVLISSAWLLLTCGYAKGVRATRADGPVPRASRGRYRLASTFLVWPPPWQGPGELLALEEVRLDVADGSLDGFADTQKVASMGQVEGNRELRASEIDAAVAHARKRFGAQTALGNYLPAFMLVDLIFLIVITIYMVGHFLFARIDAIEQIEGYSFNSTLVKHLGDDEMAFWTMAYYIKIFCARAAERRTWNVRRRTLMKASVRAPAMADALCAFPFLLFFIPILGQALHGARPTAYDMNGLLTPLLSASNIKKKQNQDKMLDEKKVNAGMMGRAYQAWRECTPRRWLRATVGAVVPPVRYLI